MQGLFAVGEASASHGVYRPGGTALNAGQVGSTRAAQYIAAKRRGAPEEGFGPLAEQALREMGALARNALARGGDGADARALWAQAGRSMSACGAAIRNGGDIEAYRGQVETQLGRFAQTVAAAAQTDLRWVFRLRDMLMSQYVYLSAMMDYAAMGGKSRGSALYTDRAGTKPFAQLPDAFTFVLDDGSRGGLDVYKRQPSPCTRWGPWPPAT